MHSSRAAASSTRSSGGWSAPRASLDAGAGWPVDRNVTFTSSAHRQQSGGLPLVSAVVWVAVAALGLRWTAASMEPGSAQLIARYAIYIVPLLTAVLWAVTTLSRRVAVAGPIAMSRDGARAFFLITGSMVFSALLTSGSWRDAVWFVGLAVLTHLPFVFRLHVRTSVLRGAVVSLALAAVAASVLRAGSDAGLFGDLITSEASGEGDWSYDMGILSLGALLAGQWVLGAVAAVGSFVAFKRGALLGLMVGWVCFVAMRIAGIRRVRFSALAAVYGVTAIAATVGFEPIVRHLTAIVDPWSPFPLSENFLTMGRVYVHGILWTDIQERGTLRQLFGFGAGTASFIIHDMAHPHNDYLRILYEQGIIGIFMWSIAYAYLLRRVRYNLAIAVLTAIILATNNNIVYVNFGVAYWLALHCLSGLPCQEDEKPPRNPLTRSPVV